MYFRSIQRKENDSNIIFASVGDKPSGEAGILLISRDQGVSRQQGALPEPVIRTIWWISTNPADPKLIFLCTIFGQIFRSQDGGESWRKMQRVLGEIRMIAWAPTPE